MYEYINGILTVKNLEYVCIDIMGLGYLIYIPFKTHEKLVNINEKEKLYIYTNVKEDDIRLYGFKTKDERDIFVKTISVSGVGPKIALSILSVFTPSEIAGIVKSDEYKILSKVPGLGVKKAQKLIIELKDKLNDFEVDTLGFEVHIIKNELKLALESLGYNKIKIEDYISDDEIKTINNSGILMKEILKKISNKK
ncbi:Holliday junction branch migration protein RuvA [Oceanivirga salmonicida]|uniref:Holliday junction branch migration protein RuvA n=1 Tax=Oceanivirga salmonicida TaxID=1769291 RepID=UPI00082B1705|nr:Holliday junction branch migration protein RuvA [Oceanivirga salmonicida]